VCSIVTLIEGSAAHSALRVLAVEYAAASSWLLIYRRALPCQMKTDRSAKRPDDGRSEQRWRRPYVPPSRGQV
jgi:hypothetical protein